VTVTALPPALDSHTLLVAAVIVHDEAAKRVLLLQRGPGSKFAPLHWDFPSGKADKGESVTAAAVRELKEETGLTVDHAALKVAGIIHGAWGGTSQLLAITGGSGGLDRRVLMATRP
jgi:8-oxo-dGTP pyrophosphatase MutT (NUDIX family)